MRIHICYKLNFLTHSHYYIFIYGKKKLNLVNKICIFLLLMIYKCILNNNIVFRILYIIDKTFLMKVKVDSFRFSLLLVKSFRGI